MFDVDITETLSLDCKVGGDGFRTRSIFLLLPILKNFLPPNLKITCTLEHTSVLKPYDVYWKVKNVGPESERRNLIRGQIINKGPNVKVVDGKVVLTEDTQFKGKHYIECYIVKNNKCVAKKRVNVPIGDM